MHFYPFSAEELEVTLHIFWTLALVMASLLAPVAHGLLPSIFSLANLLGRQGKSVGLLVLGFGPRGGVARVLPGGALPEGRN